ncbi:MAG: TrbI/VirB10 family protein [Thermomonas sp.]|uniref:TrbI/VirB10 family protein n=1 Tax=Thermomonas sp. TaxID=1971895 RepID=UPI0039E3F89A
MTLRAAPRPVTRLNRRVLIVLCGGLAAAVCIALLWSLQPHRRERATPDTSYNTERITPAENLEQLPSDYAQLPPKAEPPTLGPPLPGDLGPAMLRAQGEAPPMSPENAALLREQEATEAAGSPVFFQTGKHGPTETATAPSPPAAMPPTADMGALLTGLAPPAMASPAADAATMQNAQAQKEAFLANAGPAPTRSAGALQQPASPYQVMAGTVISAALVTGLRSDLPGDAIATVTEPVYDTATGQHVLIPQGSRLLGRYNSQISLGQDRVQVVWNRVIQPDTSSFDLDGLVGADAAGFAGLQDGVDRHWGRLLAGAALTTLLGVGAELAAPENRTDGNRIVIAGRDSVQDSINQVGQELTRRNLNVQPTLTVRPGTPVRVIVNRDLVLRPYQPMFFNRDELP